VTKADEGTIKAMDILHQRMGRPGMPGLNIGPNWRKLMFQILGFQPGHMISVAAIAKAGKTTIAQNWCLEQLKHVGEPPCGSTWKCPNTTLQCVICQY
jgi:replicative DNA helicase